MSFYYLKVAKRDLQSISSEVRKQFERDLKRKFRSYDYLCGYCEGYGFGKIEILSLEDIERINNDENLKYLHYNFLYLVSVDNEED